MSSREPNERERVVGTGHGHDGPAPTIRNATTTVRNATTTIRNAEPAARAGTPRAIRIEDLSPAGALENTVRDELPRTPRLLPLGTRIGRYILVERLGKGGMGVVYAAYDESLDRRIALKLLNERPHEVSRQLLLREARSLARVVHPNVVAVHEVGETDDGRLFLAMELVEGPTLRAWARGRTLGDILLAYLDAGRGLAAVHAAGLVHRDFKADNVLVDVHGRARVADFGLAALADPERSRRHASEPVSAEPPNVSVPASVSWSIGATAAEVEANTLRAPRRNGAFDDVLKKPLTRTGMFVGTPRYMAPEVIRGQPATRESDQYSFCIALYEALYGRHPADGPDVPGRPDSEDGRGSPQRLAVLSVLRRGLSPEPAHRHASMESLLDDLSVAGGIVDADSPWFRRQRMRVLVLLLSAAIVLTSWVLVRGPATVIATPREAFYLSFVPVSSLAIALVLTRRALLASRLNRQFVIVLSLLCGALLGHRALEFRFFDGATAAAASVQERAHLASGDLFVLGAMLAVTAVFLGRRVAILSSVAMTGVVLASLFPAWGVKVFSMTMLTLTALGVLYWRAAIGNTSRR